VAKVSASGRQSLSGDFAALSLALKFAFPGNRRLGLQRLVSRFLLTARKAKHLVLLRPFHWQISEANNAHAVRECAVDCCFNEVGREESKRNCHVHLAGCAAFAFGNRSCSCGCVDDEFFKPAAATGNGGEQSPAIFGAYPAGVL
jgi:hypothetical protein